ncbi:NUDIX domain-containing protein [Stappia sp. F7233]|uniref:NUDIX domain-containing protein n=1 Tax=Stappia albiluteola TaxID=2758565 RepID=A0A839A831_9HYPH|nr:NUDIX domain-containing protein [Stappia albiluteola]MBA5775720.1 NUDIX domain-containing protein [Stappia albiluteola]
MTLSNQAGDPKVLWKTRLLRRLIPVAGLFRRAMTIGVRLAVRDEAGRILLVRHTYLQGWYLPGGGVDAGEAIPEAAERELLEEAGLRATAPLELFALYHNPRGSRRDHVALYRVIAWEPTSAALTANREIAEARFFEAAALPDDVTPSTRRRLRELAGEEAPARLW